MTLRGTQRPRCSNNAVPRIRISTRLFVGKYMISIYSMSLPYKIYINKYYVFYCYPTRLKINRRDRFNELFNMWNRGTSSAHARFWENRGKHPHFAARKSALLHTVAKTWVPYGVVFFHFFKDFTWFSIYFKAPITTIVHLAM